MDIVVFVLIGVPWILLLVVIWLQLMLNDRIDSLERRQQPDRLANRIWVLRHDGFL